MSFSKEDSLNFPKGCIPSKSDLGEEKVAELKAMIRESERMLRLDWVRDKLRKRWQTASLAKRSSFTLS